MEVTITARHCTISDSLRARAETRLESLSRYEPRLLSALVSFENDHGAHRVEVRAHAGSGPSILATGGSEDGFQAALDGAIDRLTRQLKRRRARRRDHKAPPPEELLAPRMEAATES